MKKHLICLLGMAALATSPVLAQIPAPGFADVFRHNAMEKASASKFSRLGQPGQFALPEQSLQQLGGVKKAPGQFAMNDAGERVNLTRLTSSVVKTTDKSTNQTVVDNSTYEYNDYGLVTKITSDSEDGVNATYDYDWERPGVWKTLRLVDGTVITRTFHPTGSVATEKNTNANNDVVYFRQYDEKGEMTAGTQDNGKQQYFAPTKKWFSSTPGRKIEIGNGGKSYKETWYADENVIDRTMEFWYAANGERVADFNEQFENGVLVGGGGSKATYENGKTAITYYREDLSDSEFKLVPYSKRVLSDNWFEPMYYTPGAVYTRDYYEYTPEGVETHGQSEVSTWVSDRVLKTIVTIGNVKLTYYGMYKDGRFTNDLYYNEATGDYGTYYTDNQLEVQFGVAGAKWVYYYQYFDKNDNLLLTLKNYDDVYWSEQQPGSEEWVLCTGKKTVNNPKGGIIELEFDTKGRMTKSVYSQSSRDVRTEYTYTSDGYKYTEYYKYTKTGKDEISRRYTETNIDGVTTATTLYISVGGSVGYGERFVYNYNKKTVSRYNLSDNEWQLAYTSGMRTIEYDGNTYTLIEYGVGDDAPVYVSKRVGPVNQNADYIVDEMYFWDSNSNSWEGQNKYEIIYTLNNFNEPVTISFPKDPSLILYDYFQPVKPTTYYDLGEVNPMRDVTMKNYLWDSETNDWKLDFTDITSYSLTTEGENKKLEYKWKNNKTTYIVNADGKLLSRVQEYESGISTNEEYSYDEEGNLTHKEVDDRYSSYKTVGDYTYAVMAVLEVTGIDADNSVRFNGSVIETEGSIEVYTLAGVRVAEANDSFDTAALAPGVFVVRTPGATLKIAVK